TELPFLNVQRFLDRRGVRVPRLYAEDVAHRVVLLEDLGDETFEARLHHSESSAWPELYRQAVFVLADMHGRCETHDPSCIAYTRTFDRTLLRWELEHFLDWGARAPF